MKKQTQKNKQTDAKRKNLRRAEYIFLALVLILVIWYIFFIPHNTSPVPQTWKRLQTDDELCDALVCIKVDNTEFSSQYGYGHIYGRAVNYTGKDLSYIAIDFGLYDGSVKTGSCIANQNYLTNGTTWSFEAVCSGTSGSSYKVENITYY